MANDEQVIHVKMNTNSVANAAEDLEKALLVLRLGFGKLKAEINAALVPLGAVFVPLLNEAVWAATRLVKSVGKVVRALLGYGMVTRTVTKAQQAQVKTTEKLKRSLMGFDELNRLEGVYGTTGTQQTIVPSEAEAEKLSIRLQILGDKIRQLLAPLQKLDFTAAVEAFGRLRQALVPIERTLFAGLEWAWHNLLIPLANWTANTFLPAFLDATGEALRTLNTVVVALRPIASWLWEEFLKPLGQWTGERLIQALVWLREKLQAISSWISENEELARKIALAATAIGLINAAINTFNGLGLTAVGLLGGLSSKSELLVNPISLASGAIKAFSAVLLLLITNWDEVKSAAVAVWSTVQSVWSGAAGWFQRNLLTPLRNGFYNTVNGIIGFFNGMIAGVVGAINSLVGVVNKLQFTVPDWVPGLGGKSMGFHWQTASAPQIPYLAKGAVLPANRPFMAVVGDQRHGTNIEAPLATIQEAVSLAMEDQVSAIAAGFEASVGVQREILEAVLGIRIGDDIIGNAVTRYQQKMAVVNGGII